MSLLLMQFRGVMVTQQKHKARVRLGAEIFLKACCSILICTWLRKCKNESSAVLFSVTEFSKSLEENNRGYLAY